MIFLIFEFIFYQLIICQNYFNDKCLSIHKFYYKFVSLIEKDFPILPEDLILLLKNFSICINDGKRIFESLLLKLIIEKKIINISKFKRELFKITNIKIDIQTFNSAMNNLNFLFATERNFSNSSLDNNEKIQKTIPIGVKYNYEIINFNKKIIKIGNTLKKAIQNKIFKKFLIDNTEFSINSFLNKFDLNNYKDGFIRYEKYSRFNVHRNLNWKIKPVDLNVGGYGFDPNDKKKTNCPIFVNYHKEDNTTNTIQYKDQFIDTKTISTDSKKYAKLNNPMIKEFLNQKKTGLRLPLFINKNKKEKDFYYVGDLSVIEDSFEETFIEDKQIPIVRMKFNIDKEVDENLYKYIISP